MWGMGHMLPLGYGMGRRAQGGCINVMVFEVGMTLTGLCRGRKGMPGGWNSASQGLRHGVLQECSVFQLCGRVGFSLGKEWGEVKLNQVTLLVSTSGQQGAAEGCGNGIGKGVWWAVILGERMAGMPSQQMSLPSVLFPPKYVMYQTLSQAVLCSNSYNSDKTQSRCRTPFCRGRDRYKNVK